MDSMVNGTKPIVLICDYVHEALAEGLTRLGYDVIYNRTIVDAQVDSLLPELTGIIINSKTVMHADRINLADKLKFIGRLGSGLEIIDLKVAITRGIEVYNSPDGNRNAVAEHTSGMLLSLVNNFRIADREVRNKIWNREQNRGRELSTMRLGIIGMGNTGRTLASKLSSWTQQTLFYDPNVTLVPDSLPYICKVSLDQLQSECDVISFHVPLTDKTFHYCDNAFLQKCKEGVIILNSSRGNVVELSALIEGLENGRVAAAGLDVFANEKPHTFSEKEDQLYNRLYAMDNVLLTPHVAGWTHASLRKIAMSLLRQIERMA